MINIERLKQEWFCNINKDIVAGILIAFALIPESIGFAIIAGVDPKIGLYASCCIAIVISFVGGRPAMISAATGAMALVIVSLVKNYGIEYLFVATILAGIIQIIAGYLKISSLLHYVSHSVVLGFINALAILLFISQVKQLIGATHITYSFVILGLLIIYLFPYVTKKIPSPLVCIMVLTTLCYFFNIDVLKVGSLGNIPTTLPSYAIPKIDFSFETLKIILPYSLTIATVGLLESLLTAVIVDDKTNTPSNKHQEVRGQGLANIISGFFGGMAGCAMIGQSVMNVKSGARGRLSTFVAGAFLLFLIVGASGFVNMIPMGALIAVMIFVSISTFAWNSIRIATLKKQSKTSTGIMFVTIIIIVLSHNLAFGVVVGVLIKALIFARNISKTLYAKVSIIGDYHKEYKVYGEVCFIVSEKFIYLFDYNDSMKEITIDLNNANFWDISSVASLNKVEEKLTKLGVKVHIIGINKATKKMIDKSPNTVASL